MIYASTTACNVSPRRRYAATPLRRHADTPTRRHADTPTRRHADTPTRRHAGLFRSLWKDGTNEAKCYALLGLYWLKDPDADRFAQTLASGHISVATGRGCMVGTREEVASFVASLKSGEHIRYYFPELAASR
jgi:hypothetical protein